MTINDDRQEALEQWAFTQLGEPVAGIPASSDASFRRYFRYHLKNRTVIAMDSPPESENNPAFIDIASRLAQAGMNVPDIIACDLPRGFLLLTDLGLKTYMQVIDDDNADALFTPVIDSLVSMQRAVPVDGLPVYDEALLRKELALFPEWYLQRHLGLSLDDRWLGLLEQVNQLLIANISQQAQVFVHRDFMLRNLMASETAQPGVLDFQDAVFGPISYDPICLFKDAFISWPEERVQAWLKQYWLAARQKHLAVPEDFGQFLLDCDYMSVQRHLKVIGIFARINHRDGKSHYLSDVPRFFNYLNTVVRRRPELSALTELLAMVERQQEKALSSMESV